MGTWYWLDSSAASVWWAGIISSGKPANDVPGVILTVGTAFLAFTGTKSVIRYITLFVNTLWLRHNSQFAKSKKIASMALGLGAFISICWVIGWEGWLFCTSQEVSLEDHHWSDVVEYNERMLKQSLVFVGCMSSCLRPLLMSTTWSHSLTAVHSKQRRHCCPVDYTRVLRRRFVISCRAVNFDSIIYDMLSGQWFWLSGVPRRQPHRHSGLANLPSVGAAP